MPTTWNIPPGRTFTTIGAEYTTTPEQRAELAAAIDALVWHPLPHTMAFMPGEAIKEACRVFRLNPVKVADSHALAPFGLVGIETHHCNGIARLFLIDVGTEIVPLCSDFEPAPAVPDAPPPPFDPEA